MSSIQENIALIKAQGILPLYYHDDASVCIQIAKALYDAGIRCIEFTNRGEHAKNNFTEIVQARAAFFPELILAIGTIKTADDAMFFIQAGADILISPVFDKAIDEVAKANKILWIPGCMTPTEVHVAEQATCNIVKLFPGNVLTTGFVEAIKPLFPTMDFVVTGGVDISKENIAAWFKTGVCAIGMGSKLITKKMMDEKDYTSITSTTETVLAIIASSKN
jgi:2-dehydro-3-deoxyphosphogluconate aldolase / (4S)-4-hydroxy-2-oxoglutarate aldolase